MMRSTILIQRRSHTPLIVAGTMNEMNFCYFKCIFIRAKRISDYNTPALVTVISAVHGMGHTFSSDLNQL